ncbi:MAG: hypothetical protein P4L41_14465 [Flavipsychrobacter sp.]|nr:hypothetical protein [Flavipsychrobacter sp.]
MQKNANRYMPLIKGSWLVLTIFVVMLCGPIKRLIELRIDGSTNSSSALTIEKKLHTGYRERKEVSPLVHYNIAQPSPETALSVFIIASIFSLLLLMQRSNIVGLQIPVAQPSGIPLYLHIRKLQV